MGYVIAVDTSLSMALQPDGTVGDVDGEKTRFALARRLVAQLVDRAHKINPRPKIALYRTGEQLELLTDAVTDGAHATDLLNKSKTLYGCSKMGRLFEDIEKRVKPKHDDTLITFTDCSSFDGDMNFFTPCEARFVVVNTRRETMDEKQIEEIDQIAAESVGYEVSPANEEFYHHFFYTDFHSDAALVEALFEELFALPTYNITLGMLNMKAVLSPACWEEPSGEMELFGFCRSQNMLNCPVASHHVLLPAHAAEVEDGERSMDAPDKETETTHLPALLSETLATESSVALARLPSGRFAALSSHVQPNGSHALMLSRLPESSGLPEYMPSLSLVEVGLAAGPAADAGCDLHFAAMPQYAPASYNQSKSNAAGMNNDISKIVRLLKKLPDKSSQFYAEVNKLRNLAMAIGAPALCEELGKLLVTEAADSPKAVKQHAEHVATIMAKPPSAVDIPPLLL